MPNPRLGLLSLLAVPLHAGVIQGVVLEYQSGRPLARTIVRLQPIPGSPADARPLQLRSTSSGSFVFAGVPAGMYVVYAQRSGFFNAAFGQRRPTGQGTPLRVTADSDLFAELRMRRMGAITGRVLDENGIGIPGVPVLAYPARLPARSVASTTTDDRGVYRISGLEQDKYWIRSAAYTLDDGTSLLPTFGPRSRETVDARVHQVFVDSETPDANVQPEFGSLFRLTGKITCDNPDAPPVEVTISSETMRRTTRTGCTLSYVFEGLAPAPYEVFAQFADGSGSGFVELALERNTEGINIAVLTPPQIEFEIRNAESGAVTKPPAMLFGRREDLSQTTQMRQIAMPRTQLLGGHWEFRATVEPNQYVQSIAPTLQERRRPWREHRPADAFDVFVEARRPSRIILRVSDRAAQVTGTVTSNGDPVPGAPVFLLPVEEDARRSIGGPRQILTDTGGRYLFDGLPPGNYRLMATFDYTEPNIEMFEESRARVVTIGASQANAVDLLLWLAP